MKTEAEWHEARERFRRIASVVLPFGMKVKARMQKLGEAPRQGEVP